MKIIKHPIRCAFRAMLALLALIAPTALQAATLNIEVDYMEVSGGHSHKPQSNEIAAVVQMFACHGITLNIVVDQSIPHYDVIPRDPDDSNNFFEYYGDVKSFGYLRILYFNHFGQPNWHYCIFAHQYADKDGSASGSSGLGQRPGSYFIVTLGGFPTVIGTGFERASTLAHEFGHNLGLVHGVYENYPPNKPSIMSYFYQLDGVRSALLNAGLTQPEVALFKEMDYSNGTMCTLNESSLDEVFGSGMVSVDWNCNKVISGTVSRGIADTPFLCQPGTNRNVLADVDEWSFVRNNTFKRPAHTSSQQPEMVSCISHSEREQYRNALPAPLPQPTITVEPCITAKMVYLKPGAIPMGSGTCADPCSTLILGQAMATPGSQIFCIPGTYTLDSGPVHLNKPMTINCKIGTAVLGAH